MEITPSIAIIQPSSPPNRIIYKRSLEILKKNAIPFKSFVDFAEAPPAQKAFLLYEIITYGRFTHLWAARGGFGAIQLLPYLDNLFQEQISHSSSFPILIGFSDITVLHLYFWKKFRIKGLHAPMVINLPEISKESFNRLKANLFSKTLQGKLFGKAYREGQGEGIIIGGNLSLIASLCGTPYFPMEEKIILLIEEVNEKLYKLVRNFLQILYTLPRECLKGLMLGDLGEVSPLAFLAQIEEYLPLHIPIAYAFPFGHSSKNYPFPIGATGYLKVGAKKGELTFQF
ncbi:MAG: LD-carboxypeptidase [Caldimicrobium sp.]